MTFFIRGGIICPPPGPNRVNHGFKFQDSVCNGCHDLTMLSVNISDIAIITIETIDYHCIIRNICKSEAINLLENSVLEGGGYK